ncbi:MAG TPA: kynureninase [Chitinophagaceae bacterium]|nr:kynureninase [Chitinophagaceae bacterium]HMZ45893.1 kynureninase [Chitinophagaceae bacterium]HNF29210.1 kynureninase [Chitinophagaceae bacterium]HNM34728.1 kynureninase [Chitinophagaceae bacterium]
MIYQNTLAFAKNLDEQDEIKDFRTKFFIPQHNGRDTVYLTGNSLGLQPKSTAAYIQQELNDWANLGVEGHFHAKNPWMPYHEIFPKQLSKIVGALEEEVVVMNQLTVNLHLLMVSFYQPTAQRYKIICEAKAFPSDQYAIESQVRFHGLNYEDAVIEVEPREGEHTIREEDILNTIEQNKDSVALVLFGGVNYYTGQVFNIKNITEASHKVGALVGFDFAHATGNINLQLHNWNVDFACWCSYKYLNSGPGGVAGAFIHQKHITNKKLKRFAGWWGYNKETRFKMERGFIPIPTAEGWQLSNAPVLSMAAHKAALDIFDEVGMDRLHKKRKLLSSFVLFILDDINQKSNTQTIEIITPRNENEIGCQVSMLMLKNGKQIFNALMQQGVIADWREPNVIRIAPVPLYNSFEDVWKFGDIIKQIV